MLLSVARSSGRVEAGEGRGAVALIRLFGDIDGSDRLGDSKLPKWKLDEPVKRRTRRDEDHRAPVLKYIDTSIGRRPIGPPAARPGADHNHQAVSPGSFRSASPNCFCVRL